MDTRSMVKTAFAFVAILLSAYSSLMVQSALSLAYGRFATFIQEYVPPAYALLKGAEAFAESVLRSDTTVALLDHLHAQVTNVLLPYARNVFLPAITTAITDHLYPYFGDSSVSAAKAALYSFTVDHFEHWIDVDKTLWIVLWATLIRLVLSYCNTSLLLTMLAITIAHAELNLVQPVNLTDDTDDSVNSATDRSAVWYSGLSPIRLYKYFKAFKQYLMQNPGMGGLEGYGVAIYHACLAYLIDLSRAISVNLQAMSLVDYDPGMTPSQSGLQTDAQMAIMPLIHILTNIACLVLLVEVIHAILRRSNFNLFTTVTEHAPKQESERRNDHRSPLTSPTQKTAMVYAFVPDKAHTDTQYDRTDYDGDTSELAEDGESMAARGISIEDEGYES